MSFADGGFSVVPDFFDGAIFALVLVALLIILLNYFRISVTDSAEESGSSDVAVEKVLDEVAAENLSGHDRHYQSGSWFNRIGKRVLSAVTSALGFSAQLATYLFRHHMPNIWALTGTAGRVDVDGTYFKTIFLDTFRRTLAIHVLPRLHSTFSLPFLRVNSSFKSGTGLLHLGGLTARTLVNGMTWFSAKAFVVLAAVLGDIRQMPEMNELATYHGGSASSEGESDTMVDRDQEGTSTESDGSSSVDGSFFSSDSNGPSIGTSVDSTPSTPTPTGTPSPASSPLSSADKLKSKNSHRRGLATKSSVTSPRPRWNSSLRKLEYDPLEERFLKSLARAKKISSPSGKMRTPGLSSSPSKRLSAGIQGKLISGAK